MARLPREILNELMQLLRSETRRGAATIPNDRRGLIRELQMQSRQRDAALNMQDDAMFLNGDQLPDPTHVIPYHNGAHRVFFSNERDAHNWAAQNVFDINHVGQNEDGHYVDLIPGNDLDLKESRHFRFTGDVEGDPINDEEVGPIDPEMVRNFQDEREYYRQRGGNGKLNALAPLMGGGALAGLLASRRRQS